GWEQQCPASSPIRSTRAICVKRICAALCDETGPAGRQPCERRHSLFWRDEQEHAARSPPQCRERLVVEKNIRCIREIGSELQPVVAPVIDPGRTPGVEAEAAGLLEFAVDDELILRGQDVPNIRSQRPRRQPWFEGLKG